MLKVQQSCAEKAAQALHSVVKKGLEVLSKMDGSFANILLSAMSPCSMTPQICDVYDQFDLNDSIASQKAFLFFFSMS